MNSHVSLTVAKRLKREDWEGDAEFWFVRNEENGGYDAFYGDDLDEKLPDAETIAAPTASNLFDGMAIKTFSMSEKKGKYHAFINNENAEGYSIADALANWWLNQDKND